MAFGSFFKTLGKTLADKVKNTGKAQAKQATKSSIDWFKSKVATAFNRKQRAVAPSVEKWIDKRMASASDAMKQSVYMTQFANTGYLYFFMYDAKWKNTPQLPYYDYFPCTIPIEQYNDGFLGLNLHYLPPVLRAQLFDNLLTLKRKTIDRGRPDQYLKISYQIVKGMSQLYKPCVKRYLNTQFRSKFAKVPFDEWENAVFLPVQDFRGATAKKVWADSRKKI